jgi:hypothetical protein
LPALDPEPPAVPPPLPLPFPLLPLLPAPDPEPPVAALLPLPGLLEPCPELPPLPFPLLPLLPAPDPEPPVAALLPLPGLLEPCPELPPLPFPLLPPLPALGPEPAGPLPCPPRAFPLGADVVAVARHAESPAGYSLRNCSIAARDLPANAAEHASAPGCAALAPLERRHKLSPTKAEVDNKARLEETPFDAPLRQRARVITLSNTAKLLLSRKRADPPRSRCFR